MNPIRRKILCAVAAALWAASASSAMAQAFPSRPITIVVPYAPGGAPDTIARMLATSLTASLGQPVIVDNKSGAAGNIGAAFVAKAPPDGHTILFATQPIVTINPHLFKNMGFDPAKDLTPITAAVNVVMALSVNPSVPANNLTELMAWLKANGVRYVVVSWSEVDRLRKTYGFDADVTREAMAALEKAGLTDTHAGDAAGWQILRVGE